MFQPLISRQDLALGKPEPTMKVGRKEEVGQREGFLSLPGACKASQRSSPLGGLGIKSSGFQQGSTHAAQGKGTAPGARGFEL